MGLNIKTTTKLKSSTEIAKRLGIDKDGDVQRFFRDDCDRYMDSYIPMDSGSLKNTKSYPDNCSIVYTVPYAHYMYKGVMYISPKLGVSGIMLKSGKWWSPKGETKVPSGKSLSYSGAPKRGKEWDKRMKADRMNDIISDVENYIKRK